MTAEASGSFSGVLDRHIFWRSWTPEEAQRGKTYGVLANELLTDMHEVIGHASGQQAAGTPRLRARSLNGPISAR